MNEKPVVDAVGLFVMLTALVADPAVADVAGPYLVILAAAVIGSSFPLVRRQKSGRLSALLFMARIAGLAVLLTVGLANVISAVRPEFQVRALLAPIALMVGAIGDDWSALLNKVKEWVFGAIDLLRSGKGGAP